MMVRLNGILTVNENSPIDSALLRLALSQRSHQASHSMDGGGEDNTKEDSQEANEDAPEEGHAPEPSTSNAAAATSLPPPSDKSLAKSDMEAIIQRATAARNASKGKPVLSLSEEQERAAAANMTGGNKRPIKKKPVKRLQKSQKIKNEPGTLPDYFDLH